MKTTKLFFFLLRIIREASLRFYKYRAPISCPKRDIRRDLWRAWHSSLLRKRIISFTQMPRNITGGFKTLNLLKIDMIRFSLISWDDPNKDLFMGRNPQAPHAGESPMTLQHVHWTLGSVVGLCATWGVLQVSMWLRLDLTLTLSSWPGFDDIKFICTPGRQSSYSHTQPSQW